MLDWIGKKNEKGFVLPYVLFITSLLFIIITTSISIYEQDIKVTHYQVEQIKIETLYQSALAIFKEERELNHMPYYTTNYTFPDGKVTVTYTIIDELEYRLRFSISTNNDFVYTVLYTDVIMTDE